MLVDVIQKLKAKTYGLLRWSERYTKTDMVYLTKGGFWLGIGNVGVAFLSLILSVAFATFISPYAYGVYRYILSTAAVINAFTVTGLPGAMAKAVARGYSGTVHVAHKTSLLWSIIPASIAMIGAAYYFVQGNSTLGLSLLLVAITAPLIQGYSLYSSYLQGIQDFRKKSLYGFSLALFSSFALLITMQLTESPVALVGAFYGTTAIGVFFLYKKIIPRTVSAKPVDFSAVSFGKHTSFLNILGVFANNIDSILIFQHVGAAELALYTFATLIPERLKDFVKIIPTIATPKLAKKDTEELKKIVFQRSFIIALCLTPIAIAYIFAAPYIYALLFPAYIDAVPYSQVLAILLILAGGLSGVAISVQQAVKETYILSLFSHSSRFLLSVTLFFTYGLWGLIFARVISKILTSSLSYYLVSKLGSPRRS